MSEMSNGIAGCRDSYERVIEHLAERPYSSNERGLVATDKLTGKVGQEKVRLKKGGVLLILAGTPHRFTNKGREAAVPFSVYAPPEYPAGAKE